MVHWFINFSFALFSAPEYAWHNNTDKPRGLQASLTICLPHWMQLMVCPWHTDCIPCIFVLQSVSALHRRMAIPQTESVLKYYSFDYKQYGTKRAFAIATIPNPSFLVLAISVINHEIIISCMCHFLQLYWSNIHLCWIFPELKLVGAWVRT